MVYFAGLCIGASVYVLGAVEAALTVAGVSFAFSKQVPAPLQRARA